MRTVLAVAALSLCLAFAGHAAERLPVAAPQGASCIGHGVTHTAYTQGSGEGLGCAQFLSTNRVVQSRHDQKA